MPEKEILISISKKSRKLGIVILTESRVIYYNQNWLVNKRKSAEETAAEITEKLIDAYKPVCLVMERLTFKQQQRTQSFIKARQKIFEVAKRHRLAIKEYSLQEARASFCPGVKVTKNSVARILVFQYPEFARFRPEKPGWQIDHYQPLFNALALGFHFLKDVK